jgi:phosphoglucomutase
MELYEKYGYYTEKVTSFTLEGIDGLEKMKKLMAGLRENAPDEVAGVKICAVRAYLQGVRVCGDACEKLDYPASDVLFYEMQGGGWVCIRPSGTEPQGEALRKHRGAKRRGLRQACPELPGCGYRKMNKPWKNKECSYNNE